jgi:hypothetical protein
MARTQRWESLAFWATLVIGALILAPCLILPVWLEYQAQQARLRAAEAYLATLEKQLAATRKQIEHLQNDPAYVLRLAEAEFGDTIERPGTETVRIAPSSQDAGEGAARGGDALDHEEAVLPELSAFVEETLRQYPHARLFVHRRSRLVLMIVGGALILVAVVLLGRGGVGGGPRQPGESGGRVH